MEHKIKPASIRTTTRVIECLEAFRKLAVEKAELHADGKADLFRNASYSGLIYAALGAAQRELERVK
jgi:hypothetical protein